MTKKKEKTKKQYIIDFWKNEKNHNKEFQLSEIDSEIKIAYEKDTGSNQIYTNRAIRDLPKYGDPQLHGIVEKSKRGTYIFRPGKKRVKLKSPFIQSTKNKIKKRDNYQCQWCKKKETQKESLAVDHIIPEDDGGEGTYENGITLCTVCNNRKKNLKTSSFGKNMFKKYLVILKKNKDEKGVKFLNDLLKVYEKHNLE